MNASVPAPRPDGSIGAAGVICKLRIPLAKWIRVGRFRIYFLKYFAPRG